MANEPIEASTNNLDKMLTSLKKDLNQYENKLNDFYKGGNVTICSKDKKTIKNWKEGNYAKGNSTLLIYDNDQMQWSIISRQKNGHLKRLRPVPENSKLANYLKDKTDQDAQTIKIELLTNRKNYPIFPKKPYKKSKEQTNKIEEGISFVMKASILGIAPLAYYAGAFEMLNSFIKNAKLTPNSPMLKLTLDVIHYILAYAINIPIAAFNATAVPAFIKASIENLSEMFKATFKFIDNLIHKDNEKTEALPNENTLGKLMHDFFDLIVTLTKNNFGSKLLLETILPLALSILGLPPSIAQQYENCSAAYQYIFLFAIFLPIVTITNGNMCSNLIKDIRSIFEKARDLFQSDDQKTIDRILKEFDKLNEKEKNTLGEKANPYDEDGSLIDDVKKIKTNLLTEDAFKNLTAEQQESLAILIYQYDLFSKNFDTKENALVSLVKKALSLIISVIPSAIFSFFNGKSYILTSPAMKKMFNDSSWTAWLSNFNPVFAWAAASINAITAYQAGYQLISAIVDKLSDLILSTFKQCFGKEKFHGFDIRALLSTILGVMIAPTAATGVSFVTEYINEMNAKASHESENQAKFDAWMIAASGWIMMTYGLFFTLKPFIESIIPSSSCCSKKTNAADSPLGKEEVKVTATIAQHIKRDINKLDKEITKMNSSTKLNISSEPEQLPSQKMTNQSENTPLLNEINASETKQQKTLTTNKYVKTLFFKGEERRIRKHQPKDNNPFSILGCLNCCR